MTAAWRVLERASQLALSVAGWCYMGITLLICFDVIARRMLGFSSGATSELSGYLLALGLSWGLAATLIERSHVRIDMLVQRLRLGIRSWLHFAGIVLLAIVAGFFAWGAAALALDSWQIRATDVSQLSTPLVLPQAGWALGFGLLFVVALALAVRAGLGVWGRRDSEVERLLAARTYEEEVEETLEATRESR